MSAPVALPAQRLTTGVRMRVPVTSVSAGRATGAHREPGAAGQRTGARPGFSVSAAPTWATIRKASTSQITE